MKRKIAIFIVLATLFALAGCGQASENQSSNQTDNQLTGISPTETNEVDAPIANAIEAAIDTASESEPITIYDDENWTLELLGKEFSSRIGSTEYPAYILHIQNNSGINLKVTFDQTINYKKYVADVYLVDQDTNSSELEQHELPAGTDGLYDLIFVAPGDTEMSLDDLKMVEINFILWNLTPEGALDDYVQEYPDTHFDWDEDASSEDVLTMLKSIPATELSEDPSLVSIQALGTVRYNNEREAILLQITNNSSSTLSVGPGASVIKNEVTDFYFTLQINDQTGSAESMMLDEDGSERYSEELSPGENAQMLIFFRYSILEYVEDISTASFLLEVSGSPTDVGPYICDLNFDS